VTAFVLVPLFALAATAGFLFFRSSGGDATNTSISSASFSCQTDANGDCWVRHQLRSTPATAVAQVQYARLQGPGQAGTRAVSLVAVAQQLLPNQILLLIRDLSGRPFRDGWLEGKFTVFRQCPSSFGLWCRPPTNPGGGQPRPGASATTGAPAPRHPNPAPSAQSPGSPAPPSQIPVIPIGPPTTTPTVGPTTTPTPWPGGSTTPGGPVTTGTAGPPRPTGSPTASPPGRGNLVFADDFDGPAGSAPDSPVWTPTIGDKWGVNELECYTSSPNNIQLDGNGHLDLIARHESSCNGRSYSSGRIETRGKASWRYGYFEVRAKMPTGPGMFPAIWMLGPNGVTDWPKSGETDIVEVISSKPGLVHTNVHGIDDEGGHWEAGWDGGNRDATYGGNLDDGYHTYGLSWTAGQLQFYFDNQLIRTIRKTDVPIWLWDQNFYMIFDAAVGSFGGTPAAASYPQTMSIDYLHVYSSRPTT